MKTFGFKQNRVVWALLCAAVAVFYLMGCGGGGASTAGETGSGDLVVSLTDAEGDFAAYTVDVVALTLTKANGAEVATLPMTARLDFTQYTDMTEFLTAATVPAGAYVAAHMVLDYRNADIWVEDAAGELIQVADIVDVNGQAVDRLDMTVQLEDRNRLVIAPGIPAHLQLDFDLAATNTVSFNAQNGPSVTVDPYLIADVNRVDSKIHRLRGLLNDVDLADQSFSLFIRPFYAALTGSHSRFGQMTVVTGSDTLFELDGTSYEGATGLAAMQTLDPLAAVVAVGRLQFNPLRFVADQVYGGSSVPWGDQDIVSGTVIARSGDVLTIKGATLFRDDGSVMFCGQVQATIGQDTLVTRQLSRHAFTTDDISVGQRVTVFGSLVDDDPMRIALDATAGHVRMKLTTVRGSVVTVDSGDSAAQLDLALQSINHFRVGIFDFSGTGATAQGDADPDNYEVNGGAIDTGGLSVNTPVKVRGFVQPFGAAPHDFNAQTIINVADLRAFLKVHWEPASAAALDAISSDGLTLDLDGVGLSHHIFRGWVLTDLTALAEAPTIVPPESGAGLFILRLDGVVQLFFTFDGFVEALEDYLADGWKVATIWARGQFNDASAALTADLVDIDLK